MEGEELVGVLGGPPLLSPTPKQELSGVAVVIIIAVGVQTVIMLFIFAKRQIMRFALKGRRGPHVSVGQGGLKLLRKEIDRRIEYAAHIRHEPRLATANHQSDASPDAYQPRERVVAVDKLVELDNLVADYDPAYYRPAWANPRSFLIDCLAGPLVGIEPKKIHRFCDLYEHARHSYKPFLDEQLTQYIACLKELKLQVIHNIRNKPACPKKGSTPPNLRRAVNRPQHRTFFARAATESSAAAGRNFSSVDDNTAVPSAVVKHRLNSSTVLITADALGSAGSTPV